MLTIVGLDDATIEAAGALIASEHAEARRAHPGLPPTFAGAEACTAALQRLRDSGHTGLVASKRGRPLAVMTGIARGDHARLPAEGFAVAPDLEDPTTVLARLYGELAPELVAAGMLRHYIDHVVLPPLDTALSNLGFGRHHVYASQPAAPRSSPAGVRVRVGGTDDLAAVARLALVEIRFRATPPVYGRAVPRTLEEVLDHHRALHQAGATHLLATVDGRDVGLLTIELTSPAPRLCPDGQPYIGPTATNPDARGRGVGRALVDTTLTWAHAHGYRWVSVDFEPANPLSRPFWLGNGFRPIGYGVLRSIDARALEPFPARPAL
jgi:GNAT superfamily N-acetyltransferase